MTIEVRQLLIRSRVSDEGEPPREEAPRAASEETSREILRDEVLEECRRWLDARRVDRRER